MLAQPYKLIHAWSYFSFQRGQTAAVPCDQLPHVNSISDSDPLWLRSGSTHHIGLISTHYAHPLLYLAQVQDRRVLLWSGDLPNTNGSRTSCCALVCGHSDNHILYIESHHPGTHLHVPLLLPHTVAHRHKVHVHNCTDQRGEHCHTIGTATTFPYHILIWSGNEAGYAECSYQPSTYSTACNIHMCTQVLHLLGKS